jgi:creatinine amidohydrolase
VAQQLIVTDLEAGRTMRIDRLSELTWVDVRELDGARVVALLPIGAVEAHGPHLPLATDVIIARAWAESGARKLAAHGFHPLLLPPVAFATAFAGTISVRPATVAALLVDIATSLHRGGLRRLALVNAHFDPAHLEALGAARDAIRDRELMTVVFPDLTTRPWGGRLTDEFKSGASHAGQYEGSIVLAHAPELVREAIRRALPPNPASLSDAIRDGNRTFTEAGGPEAYFGDPARATAEEGLATIDVLGSILEEAVLQAVEHEATEAP